MLLECIKINLNQCSNEQQIQHQLYVQKNTLGANNWSSAFAIIFKISYEYFFKISCLAAFRSLIPNREDTYIHTQENSIFKEIFRRILGFHHMIISVINQYLKVNFHFRKLIYNIQLHHGVAFLNQMININIFNYKIKINLRIKKNRSITQYN
ncbi:unnamed protein product [Paramecium octaurelia]|uniref:Uncharacterized protein n=1 Tax=Paramecium octaurelia TaxID=43137 RepID=A0A8S1WR42_PAROT|nr:unnamed protein product [Paramecium octaurelia]